MTKKEEVQEWFLIKWNWDSWLLTLSDEDAGKVLKALYTGVMPDGLLGTLINSHFDEFKRVNDFRAEKQKERSETNSENAKSRWEKYRELESERKEKFTTVYNRIDNDTTVSNRTTTVSNRNANTEDILHSTHHIEHSIDDVVNNTKDIVNNKKDIVVDMLKTVNVDMEEGDTYMDLHRKAKAVVEDRATKWDKIINE